jgi:hypothetical protein
MAINYNSWLCRNMYHQIGSLQRDVTRTDPWKGIRRRLTDEVHSQLLVQSMLRAEPYVYAVEKYLAARFYESAGSTRAVDGSMSHSEPRAGNRDLKWIDWSYICPSVKSCSTCIWITGCSRWSRCPAASGMDAVVVKVKQWGRGNAVSGGFDMTCEGMKSSANVIDVLL